jgi:predicted GNAT family acetyltransferase
VPGARGEAAAVAAFGAVWGEVRSVPVVPVEAERLYVLDELRPLAEGSPAAAAAATGSARVATDTDAEVVTGLVTGFIADVAAHDPLGDASAAAAALIAGQRLLLWHDDADGPVAMAVAGGIVAGVGRVSRVYVPPARRGRGYAACVTAAVTRRLVDEGLTPVLITQLLNPSANTLYRRLGYRAVGERLSYRFG